MEKSISNKTALDYKTKGAQEQFFFNFLDEFVVGQNFAKNKLALKLANFGNRMTKGQKPAGVFILIGPKGTGKNHLIKTFAKLIFNDQDAIVRVNCSLFSESMICQEMIDAHGFNQDASNQILDKQEEIKLRNKANKDEIKILQDCIKLVNTENGDEEKKLLEQKIKNIEIKIKNNIEELKKFPKNIKRRPGSYFSIVLFEGIDQAHPGVINIIRQIINRGNILLSNGKYCSFSNCFIFLDCGFVDDFPEKTIRLPGPKSKTKNLSNNERYEKIKTPIHDLVPPEIIKEVGKEGIIVFHPFTEDEFRKIIDLNLLKLKKIQVAGDKKEIIVNFTQKVKDFIYEEARDSFNKDLGASAIDRVIEKEISEPIFNLISKGSKGGIIAGDEIEIDVIEKSKNKKEILINKIQNT